MVLTFQYLDTATNQIVNFRCLCLNVVYLHRFVGVGHSTPHNVAQRQAGGYRTHQQGLRWVDHLAGWIPA